MHNPFAFHSHTKSSASPAMLCVIAAWLLVAIVAVVAAYAFPL